MDIYLYKEEDEVTSDIDTITRDDEESEGEEALFCRFCSNQITAPKFSIEVDGGHHHTFFNPAGIVFEIRCFSNAEGCIQHGPASSEFAWFKAHTWRIALCSGCLSHMGWFFSSGEMHFFGLIAKNLST